jgi:hypothetical protein
MIICKLFWLVLFWIRWKHTFQTAGSSFRSFPPESWSWYSSDTTFSSLKQRHFKGLFIYLLINSIMQMRRLTQIHSGHMTITVGCINGKDTVKWITTSEQAHISISVNDMNPSRICWYSKTQNCTRKVLIKVFSCVESINEANKCVSLELCIKIML